ncbi:hypothetical protein [Glutamicibacter nicotianae]|uniref:hypothetical protein n=1 Tax=Glutamicibacter nicotianae TaxID=37929 RepID=UPI0025559283|nr:hypothetical protein [Glutamicibacter nicotianae]WIV42600.1 hypothetical protein QQS42_09670 [Glutamicibacter nicotianae]
MNKVMAFCPTHGAFPSRLVQGEIQGLHLQGNIESCPICGTLSRTMEGSFNIGPDIFEIISAPTWTKIELAKIRDSVRDALAMAEKATSNDELLAAVQELTAKVEANDARVAEFIKSQAALNRSLFGRMDDAERRGKILGVLNFLYGLFVWAVPASDVVDFTRQNIQPIIEQLAAKFLQ